MENMKRFVAGVVMHERTDANGVIHSQVLIGKKIVKEGHYLSNQWHIPGGKILEKKDANGVTQLETDQEAVIREIKEECNLDVKVLKKIGDKVIDDFILSWYLCSLVSGEAKAGDDLQEIKWVDKKDACDECSETAVSRWPEDLKKFLL